MQSTAMDPQPRAVSASPELSVYIGEAGRPFSRVSMAVTNMHGRTRAGNRDAVEGEGSARSFRFPRQHDERKHAARQRRRERAMTFQALDFLKFFFNGRNWLDFK